MHTCSGMLRTLLGVLLSCTIGTASCQSIDTVYNQYLDFNLARFQNDQDNMVILGEALIPNADKLPASARVNFYFAIGNIYEHDGQIAKALSYYEQVVAYVPDYYVVHRALGYLYIEKAKAIEKRMALPLIDSKQKEQLEKEYHATIKAALPHLEKAQACDPSEETLQLIKQYETLNGNFKALKSLPERLKMLSHKCIDILMDQ